MPESKQSSSENNINSGNQNSNSDSSSVSSSSSSSSSSITLINNKSNNPTSTSTIIAQSNTAQVTEKPSHYTYLKGFRVEQCSLFLQHKCTQHRPYTCFYWHFKNQRRRRPLRKRDGTFNYNPDIYCDKYDEQTGLCPNSDECPLVHRNAGDTEKRYHLRYYKTATCIHETDAKGNCTKNGPHCAFAHGASDMRPPVYDIRELQLQQQQQQQSSSSGSCSSSTSSSSSSSNSNNNLSTTNNSSIKDSTNTLNNNNNNLSNSNSNNQNTTNSINSNNDLVNEKAINLSTTLEKERILNEDPKWNDTNYVLINYKTEQCKRPPRLCRQGFACPQYHNARDKRRNPSIYKYRSTPCPNVKQGDDWLEPTVCENGDSCKYCHSRTEQQFHPEIYKSSKCNDMISTGYCPRGPFCAFAHIEQELKNQRTHSTSESSSSDYTLENFISNALPNAKENDFLETNNNSDNINVSNNDLNESFQQQLNLKNKNDEMVINTNSNNLESLSNQINSIVAKELSLTNSIIGSNLNSSSSSYNKPIGSEREKPKSLQQQQLLFNSQLLSNTTKNLTLMSNARSSSPYQLLNQDQDQISSPNVKLNSNANTPKTTSDNQNVLGNNASNQSNSSSSSSSSPSPISSATSLNNRPTTISTTTTSASTTVANQNVALSSPSSNLAGMSPSVNGVVNSIDSSNYTSASAINSLQLLNSALLENNNLINNTQQKFNPVNNSTNTNQSTALPLNLTHSQQQQLQQQLQRQQQQNILSNLNSSASGQPSTPTSGLIDLEKEKLKQDLAKQTEMSNKLETLCLQYRQWVEKLTIDLNDLKAKYIRSESERKNLELQLFNKLSIEQTLASNRNFNINSNNQNSNCSSATNNMNTINANLTNLTNLTNNNNNSNNNSNVNLSNISNKK